MWFQGNFDAVTTVNKFIYCRVASPAKVGCQI